MALSLLLLSGPAAVGMDGGRRGGLLLGGNVLGGGAIPAVGAEQFVAMRVSRDTRRITFWSNLADYRHFEQCGAVFAIKRSARVRSDGTFRVDEPFPPGGHLHLEGRFVRADKAVGIVRVTHEAGTTDCSSGTVHWQALSPDLGVGSGALRAGAFYGGYTTQTSSRASVRLPVLIKTGGDRRRVAEMAAYVNNLCAGHAVNSQFTSNDFFEVWLPIESGSFGVTRTFSQPAQAGQTAYFTVELHGRFGALRAFGTLRVRAVIRNDADDSLTDRCGGRLLEWSASR